MPNTTQDNFNDAIHEPINQLKEAISNALDTVANFTPMFLAEKVASMQSDKQAELINCLANIIKPGPGFPELQFSFLRDNLSDKAKDLLRNILNEEIKNV